MAKPEQRKSAAGVGYSGRQPTGPGRPVSGSLSSSNMLGHGSQGAAPQGNLADNGSDLFKSAKPTSGQLPERSDPNATVGPGKLPMMQQVAPVAGQLQSPESVTPQSLVKPSLPERLPPNEPREHKGMDQHDRQAQQFQPSYPSMEMPGPFTVDPRRPMIEPPGRPTNWGGHFFRE